MNLPGWWVNASGVFFILGSVAVIALVILTVVLVHVALELNSQIKRLTNKVEILTEKTTAIADQVKDLTQDVSIRTKGIVKMVDDNAITAFGIVEKFAPALVAAGVVFRMFKLLGGRRKKPSFRELS